jgi:hypothetical protein
MPNPRVRFRMCTFVSVEKFAPKMEILYDLSFTSFGLRELMTGDTVCCVGVAVGVTGVLVGVGVFVLPGTGVLVAVGLGVLVGVFVAVAVGVPGPAVFVGLGVWVTVGVLVGVFVAPPGVLVGTGGELVTVGVGLGVSKTSESFAKPGTTSR